MDRFGNIRGLFVDFDGTLVDYTSAEEHAFLDLIKLYQSEKTNEIHEYYNTVNHQLWDLFEQKMISIDELVITRFKKVCAQYDIEADPATMNRQYLERLIQFSDLFPNIIEDLQMLTKQKIPLILLTNGIREVQHSRIEKTGIGPFFKAIITSGDVQAGKPAPFMFEKGMNVLDIRDRSQLLMVGDSLQSDIEGAYRLGIGGIHIHENVKINGSSEHPGIIASYDNFNAFVADFLATNH